MTTKQQKVRIGLFAVVACVLAAVVLVVFGGVHFWEKQDRYYVVFDKSVMGLEPGANVHLNGLRVGKVSEIKLSPDDPSRVRVAIDVDEGTPIRLDTKAIMQMAGITGLKVIDLRGGTAESPAMPVGGTIAAGAGMFDKLEQQAEKLVDESSRLLETANRMMERADRVVTNLDQVTDPKQLGEIIAHTRATARNLQQASASLKGLVDENRAGLKASIASVELTAKRAADLVDTDQVKAVVADLRQASRNFKELTREVRQKPSRLIFSNPEPDRKLP